MIVFRLHSIPGWYMSTHLQLKTSKTRSGFALDLVQSAARLEFWKSRFAITDEDIGERVNNVNVVNVKPGREAGAINELEP